MFTAGPATKYFGQKPPPVEWTVLPFLAPAVSSSLPHSPTTQDLNIPQSLLSTTNPQSLPWKSLDRRADCLCFALLACPVAAHAPSRPKPFSLPLVCLSRKGFESKTPLNQAPWTLTPESPSPSVSSRLRTGVTLPPRILPSPR